MPAQFALPPDTRATGTGSPAADMDAVIDAVTAMGAGMNILNAAFAGGADPTGTNDSTAAIQAAGNAVLATGLAGRVLIPPGTYKMATTATWSSPGVTLYPLGGPGSVVLANYGSGPCVRMYSTASYSPGSVFGGGIDGGIIIDGTHASAGASGFRIGDIYGLRFDVGVRNFQGAGSAGAWLDNNYWWAEQMTGRIWAEQCTSHVVFDQSANISGNATGSFDRAALGIWLDGKGKGNLVTFQNGAFIEDGPGLAIQGNTDYGAALYYALTLTGSNAGGYSRLVNIPLYIGVECNGTTGTQPGTINFASTGNNQIRNCTGLIDFTGNNAFAGAVNAAGSFQFDGIVLGDSQLQRVDQAGQVAYAHGAIGNNAFINTRYNGLATAAPASAVTGAILQTNDPGTGGGSGGNWSNQTFTLVNTGTGSITMAASGTSHVSTGVSCVIQPGQAQTFIWIANNLLWYPVQ